MRNVTNTPTINQASDQKLLIKRYEKEIRELKQELSMHDTLASQGTDKPDADQYSAEKQYEIQKTAQSYLDGSLEDIENLGSTRMINEYLLQMRNLFNKMVQESDNILQHSDTIKSAGGGPGNLSKQETMKMEQNGVGDIEDAGEFGLGKARHDAKPVNKIEVSKEREAEIAMMNEWQEAQDT
jgi:kinesin family protein 6/9